MTRGISSFSVPHMGMGHHHGHSHGVAAATNSHNEALMRRATYFSTAMAFILLSAKLYAWWVSDSLAMLSSLTDSIFDLVSSALNLAALHYALKPADDDHRFGHTSAEDIAGLAQFAFISASMIIIILQSIERLANPRPLMHETIGIWVSVGAMGFTMALVAYQTFVTRRTGSLIVASDRLHYAGDILFNLGVLLSLYISREFGISWADPAMAMTIAIAVLWSSRRIGIHAFHNLMDREMPDAEKEKISTVLKKFPEIFGYHHLKTRYAGIKAFVQMHIEVDATLNFRDAHAITERLENALLEVFPNAEIIIHPDPIEPEDRDKHQCPDHPHTH